MSDFARTDLERLGQQLQASRISKGWSPDDVARRSGCAPTRLGTIETGEAAVALDELVDIGGALNMTLMFVPLQHVEEVRQMIGLPEPQPWGPDRLRSLSVYEEVYCPDPPPGKGGKPGRWNGRPA